MAQTKRDIYDELSRVLTDYEHREDIYENIDWETELYEMLVKIQNRWEDTITKEDLQMSRIDNIVKFATKQEMEQVAKETAKLRRIEGYKENIKSLKPRIDELLAVGNACLKHNIPIEGKAWGGHEGYDTHQFISNGWSHVSGFIREYSPNTRQVLPLTKVGKIGGGACNYNLTTDGVTINVSGDIEYVLKKFLDDFDTFETEFYKYVDKVTAQ